MLIRPLNKGRQCAPSGPDSQTAARFARRCFQRYVAKTSTTALEIYRIYAKYRKDQNSKKHVKNSIFGKKKIVGSDTKYHALKVCLGTL